MPLNAPGFWSAPPGTSALAKLLGPLGALYHSEVQRRLRTAKPYRADVPVICVGNATMGGVGKTPFVRWLVGQLEGAAVLTRGYGGTEAGPLRVSADHDAAAVGDEPLLLAADAQVWVSRDRAAGAQAAADAGATLIVMDDGLQNPSLHKDLSLLLVDGDSMFGNGAVFPAGPLREKPEAARSRCDAVVAMLPNAQAAGSNELGAFAGNLPLIEAWFAVDAATIPQAPLLAVCGIGRPERFFRSLQDLNADVLDYLAFADHHAFTPGELEMIRADARRLGATIVMTEKDYVRLPPEAREGIHAIRGGVVVRDEAPLMALLETLR